MQRDPRYHWLEHRIVTTIEPKRDALNQLIQNDENRFVCFSLEFISSHYFIEYLVYALNNSLKTKM